MTGAEKELIAVLKLIASGDQPILEACYRVRYADTGIKEHYGWWEVQSCTGMHGSTPSRAECVLNVRNYQVNLGFMMLRIRQPDIIEVFKLRDSKTGIGDVILDTTDGNGLDGDPTFTEDLTYRIKNLEKSMNRTYSNPNRAQQESSVKVDGKTKDQPSKKLTAIARVTISVFAADPRFCARNCHLMCKLESGSLSCKATEGRLDQEKPSAVLPLRPKRTATCRRIFGGVE